MQPLMGTCHCNHGSEHPSHRKTPVVATLGRRSYGHQYGFTRVNIMPTVAKETSKSFNEAGALALFGRRSFGSLIERVKTTRRGAGHLLTRINWEHQVSKGSPTFGIAKFVIWERTVTAGSPLSDKWGSVAAVTKSSEA
jgi:hypothetical protein